MKRSERARAARALRLVARAEAAHARVLRAALRAYVVAEGERVLGHRGDSRDVLLRTVAESATRTAVKVLKASRRAAESMGIGMPDLRLGSVVEDFRDRNLWLIEAAGREYAADVRAVIEDPANEGLHVEGLRAKILERADVSESRAELIARDQTLKLAGQVNRVRQENAGIKRYEWSTSRDERVRDTHVDLEGKVFSWDSPPEPGHPGEDFQCRCVAIPVFED